MTLQVTWTKLADGNEKAYPRYKCSRACRGQSYPPEVLDVLVEDHFLQEYGDLEVTRREWQQGNDLAADLEMVEGQIKRLRSEQDAGLIVTDDDHDQYLRRMKVLTDRRTGILEQEPVSPGWVYTPTGKTFRQTWADLEGPEHATERRDLLVARGVRLEVDSATPLVWRMTVPPQDE